VKESLREKLVGLVERYEEVSRLLSDQKTIADKERFRDLSKEYARLAEVTQDFEAYRKLEADIAASAELRESDDSELRGLAEDEHRDLVARRDARLAALLNHLVPKDPDDDANLFLEIRAGTGGDEAAIFAGDLYRMYSRYAERQGWSVEVLSANPGEHGGYREIITRVVGKGAYAKLKFESGVHRVQRVPETEAQGRIHTSTCTVAVFPEPEDVGDIEINKSDLKVDTYRASGAGGQHINKTDSAVRLTHLPTNIVVQCQDSRSQHSNRDVAWRRLRSRLYDFEMRKRMEEQQKLEATKTDVGWGHQIRSYVLDQSRIKDLRTNVEISNTQKVLDGDLDAFIEASLKQGV
jgi:peptide chain release factor 1